MGRGGGEDLAGGIAAKIPFTRARREVKSEPYLQRLALIAEDCGLKKESELSEEEQRIAGYEYRQKAKISITPDQTYPGGGWSLGEAIYPESWLAHLQPRMTFTNRTQFFSQLKLDYKTGDMWLVSRAHMVTPSGWTERVRVDNLGPELTPAVEQADEITNQLADSIAARTGSEYRPLKKSDLWFDEDEFGREQLTGQKDWYQKHVVEISDNLTEALEEMPVWRREDKLRREGGLANFNTATERAARAERLAAEANERSKKAERRAKEAELRAQQAEEQSRRAEMIGDDERFAGTEMGERAAEMMNGRNF